MQDDELEEEFRRLTSELAETPELQVDDTESPKAVSVGLVLAPVDNAPALAALLKMSGQDVRVVKTDPWAAAWVPLSGESSSEDDEAALLTGYRPIPEPVDVVARAVSKLTPYGAVAIVSWLGDSEGVEVGISGDIAARRYVGGEPEERLEAGILLNQLDSVAEDLLLGRATPDDFPEDEGGWRRFFRRPRGNV